MKRILFVLVSLLISNAVNFCQDTTANALKCGKFAIQFQVGSSFTLRPFSGASFSGKYQLSSESAVRFGIGINGSTDFENKVNNHDTTKAQNLDFNLNAQYIRYLKTVEDVSLYAGTGPYYSRYFYRSDFSHNRDNDWSIGINFLLGVEWFFKDNMSLSAEYGLLIQYLKSNSTSYGGENTSNSKSIIISNGNQFNFGLSIYL